MPNTLVGLGFALLSGVIPRVRDGLLLGESNTGLAHLFLTRRGFGAITFGRVVVSAVPITPRLLVHESHHARQLVGRARQAMEMFASCGADVLLAGHLHASHTGDTAARYKIGDYAALVVQAGTATSLRGRGEANSFNLLRIESPRVSISR